MTYLARPNDVELTDLDKSIPNTVSHAEQLPTQVGNVVVMPKTKRKAAAPYTFDYSGVSAAVAKEAEATAKRIRDRLRMQTIETGKELLAIKKALGHGKFGKWLEHHFGWKERTAQNYMNSATAFGSTPHIIDMLPPSTVYKLAAKSTPDALRQSVIDEIELGKKPDPKQIERKIAATRREARQNGDSKNASADSSQEVSDISVQDNAITSLDQASAIEVPAAASLGKDAAQFAPSTQVQELLAQKIVGLLKKRFGDKFSHLRDIILKIDIAVLRKALSET